MPKVSPTLQVLREIRDEIRQTNHRLGAVEAEITAVKDGLSVLARRQVETEVRLATELVANARVMTEVRDLIR